MKSVNGYGRPAWVIGSPISHTLSPILHNTLFEANGMAHRYFALEVKPSELEDFVRTFETIDALGANLTLPLKEAVREYVSTETDHVKATGAANTLYREGSELALDNTDVEGFKYLVRDFSDELKDSPVILLGAGGAARACLQGFKDLQPGRVLIWNRTTEKAHEIREQIGGEDVEVISDEALESGQFEAKFVVNATSLGLNSDDASPFPASHIRSNMVGIDLIYGRETQFLLDFDRKGRTARGGLDMLVAQAASAWERWVGQSADIEIMRQAVADRSSVFD